MESIIWVHRVYIVTFFDSTYYIGLFESQLRNVCYIAFKFMFQKCLLFLQTLSKTKLKKPENHLKNVDINCNLLVPVTC